MIKNEIKVTSEAWWSESCPCISLFTITISWTSKTQQITPSLHTSTRVTNLCITASRGQIIRLGGTRNLPLTAGATCRRRERGEVVAGSQNSPAGGVCELHTPEPWDQGRIQRAGTKCREATAEF